MGYVFRTLEQQMAVDGLRRYLDAEIEPIVKQYRDKFIPREQMAEIMRGLTQYGLIAGAVSEQRGGMGIGWLTHLMLFEELAYTSCDLSTVVASARCTPSTTCLEPEGGSSARQRAYDAEIVIGWPHHPRRRDLRCRRQRSPDAPGRNRRDHDSLPGNRRGLLSQSGRHRRRIHQGTWKSGDLGYIDDGGYLFIVDRKKDMIIGGGFNVYAVEVEAALASHPAVLMSAVVGVPHTDWGEAVHAEVVLRSGAAATAAELIAHVRSKIGGYKAPKTLTFVESLPLTAVGKVLRRVVKEKYWVGRERRIS